MTTGRGWLGAWVVLVLVATPARADFPYEQEPINYLTATTHDPIARLQQRIDKGEVTLTHDEEGQGYLKAVLDALKVAARIADVGLFEDELPAVENRAEDAQGVVLR